MNNRIFLVFLKEMKMIFRDRRMIATMVITSLVVMPAIFGFIRNMDKIIKEDDTVKVVVENRDDVIHSVLSSLDNIKEVSQDEFQNGKKEEYLVFRHLDGKYILGYDSTNKHTSTLAFRIKSELAGIKEKVVNETLTAKGITDKELQPFVIQLNDWADAEKVAGQFLAKMIPYLVIIFLVSNSARAVFIAVGEKEKNTLASLLVTQTPRYVIVLGKVLAIMAFTVLSSILIVTGMVMLTNFGMGFGGAGDVQYSMSPVQILHLFFNITSLALFISTIVMLIGTYARTEKEANIYSVPLIFASIFMAMMSFSGATFSLSTYTIPILGSAMAMKDVFLLNFDQVRLLLPVVLHLVYAGVLVLLAVVLYERETVLFRK